MSAIACWLKRCGLWPWHHVSKENLSGGVVTLFVYGPGIPARTEHYDLGPNVGDEELAQIMGGMTPRAHGMSYRSRLKLSALMFRLTGEVW